MYSQRNEEEYILKYFKDFTGRFLDIGAYDGKCFSNTLKLVELGWSGICLEPSPSVYPALEELHKPNSNVLTLPLALGSQTKKMKMFDSLGDAISTFVLRHKQLWETNAGSKFKEVEVDMISVTDFFEKYGCNFDFINIDIEGMDLEILRLLPLSQFKKRSLICIEYDDEMAKMEEYAKVHQFLKTTSTVGNLFLRKI